MSDNALTTTPPATLPIRPLEETDGSILMKWESQGVNVACSWDMDKPEGKSQILAAMAPSDKRLKDCVNRKLAVKDWFAHVVEFADAETGEVRTGIRIVLFTESDGLVSTGSGPFAKGWSHVMHLYGRGPYDPPLLVEVGTKAVDGVKSYLYVKSAVPAARPVEANGAKPRK